MKEGKGTTGLKMQEKPCSVSFWENREKENEGLLVSIVGSGISDIYREGLYYESMEGEEMRWWWSPREETREWT
ncbi:conserved hypothetical protein [Ricinus communis]|uniref:Uncharacterized protein n=1 Tax=Ricinus communis TaxID=3988 RepID=B9SU03_RICCO|nr:conserved hypothetical protein [Ricinus communis]